MNTTFTKILNGSCLRGLRVLRGNPFVFFVAQFFIGHEVQGDLERILLRDLRVLRGNPFVTFVARSFVSFVA